MGAKGARDMTPEFRQWHATFAVCATDGTLLQRSDGRHECKVGGLCSSRKCAKKGEKALALENEPDILITTNEDGSMRGGSGEPVSNEITTDA